MVALVSLLAWYPSGPAEGWLAGPSRAVVAVSTTFGPTHVAVTSPAMRCTVTLDAVLAFVFNTVSIVPAMTLMLS